MDKSEIFKEAHRVTRRIIARAARHGEKLDYRAQFGLCLARAYTIAKMTRLEKKAGGRIWRKKKMERVYFSINEVLGLDEYHPDFNWFLYESKFWWDAEDRQFHWKQVDDDVARRVIEEINDRLAGR